MKIYLAGGCFWGTEHFLKLLKGVLHTDVGYANGNIENPTYKEVCSGETNFAETVEVEYDPNIISLSKILDMFFKTIDPTSLNKQGGDIGTQYRTGIYYTDTNDIPIIKEALATLAKNYDKPIVIKLMPLQNYYSAENYHQDYLVNNPTGYCHISPELFDLAKKV